MSYCTIVEFEWSDADQRGAFETLTARDDRPVEGRIIRILSIDDAGARAVEVWSSPADARCHAENSAPDLGSVNLPTPSRVVGFAVTSLQVS